MGNQDWLRAVRSVLEEAVPQASGIESLIGTENFDFGVLCFGYSLELIKSSDAVAIELDRYNLRVSLSHVEQAIAFALFDELDHVEDTLSVGCHEISEDSHVKEIWLYTIVSLMRRRWPAIGSDFPERQFVELHAAWGGDNFLSSFLARSPLNRWYFGECARRRFLRILDQDLLAERARLGLPITADAS